MAEGDSKKCKPAPPEQLSEELEAKSPSAISQRLQRLKDKSIQIVHSREKVPQPLFWSLFHSEIAEIKRSRETERKIKKIIS